MDVLPQPPIPDLDMLSLWFMKLTLERKWATHEYNESETWLTSDQENCFPFKGWTPGGTQTDLWSETVRGPFSYGRKLKQLERFDKLKVNMVENRITAEFVPEFNFIEKDL